MLQSLAKNLIHLLFSTSMREPVLAEAVRGRYAHTPQGSCATSIHPALRSTRGVIT